jgi:hypothetical protein
MLARVFMFLKPEVVVDAGPLVKLKTLLDMGTTTDPRIATMFKRWAIFYRSFAQQRFVKASRGDGTWAPLKRERPRDREANKKRFRKFMREKTKLFEGRLALSKRYAKGSYRVALNNKGGLRGAKKSKAKKAYLSRISKRFVAIAPAILRDTSTLFTVLNPVKPGIGSLETRDGRYLFVGYGGVDIHPGDEDDPNEGRLTVAQIAGYHQVGDKERNLPARPIIVQPDFNTTQLIANEAMAAQQFIINREAVL